MTLMHTFLFNTLLILLTITYCFVRIFHYGSILLPRIKIPYIYCLVLSSGSIFFIISYNKVPTWVAFTVGFLIIIFLLKISFHISLKQCFLFSQDFILIPFLMGSLCTSLSISISLLGGILISPNIINLETITAFLLSIFFVYYLYIKKIDDKYWLKFIASKKRLNIILLSQTSIFIFLSSFSFLYDYNLYSWVWVSYFLILLSVFILYEMLLHFIIKDSVITTFKIKNEILEEQLKLQLSNYDDREELMTELRKFKHDYNSFIQTTQNLLELNETEAALVFIRQTTTLQTQISPKYREFSNNLYIQSALNSVYQNNKEKNISFSAEVPVPSNLNINSFNLYRIFMNLLNNALDAVLNEQCEKKIIQITSAIHGKWYKITFKNTHNGTIIEKNNFFITNKQNSEEHGFGLRIVEDILKESNGFISISYDSGTFTVNIQIPLK